MKHKNGHRRTLLRVLANLANPIAQGRQMHRSNVFSFKSISADCARMNVVNIITFASRLPETTRISVP